MRALIGVVLSLAIAAPAAAQGLKVTVPDPVAIPALPAGTKVQAVSLTRLAANIAPGTAWEEDQRAPYFMLPCVSAGELSYWKEANNSITALQTFDRVFRDELKKAGLKVGGDPTNLFEEQNSSDLQIGALITALAVKTCTTATLVKFSLQGSATMDVEWQVYSVSQGKVLVRVSTHAGFVLLPQNEQNASLLVAGVFADSVRRLAADDQFRRIVVSEPSSGPATLPGSMSFSAAKPGRITLDTAAKGVVSVFAGDGFGSGVLISPDGYLLTNFHVAGQTGQVRIRWPDGSDTVGEVLRGDRRRDVALIKTTPKGASLALRHAPVQLGETVFAIGTPLDKKLAGTVTRGIVSSTRLIDGQSWIQSDVTVNHGNSGGPLLDESGAIVGLTAWGVAPNDAPTGLNFFIPIDDALRVLALVPSGG